MKQTLEEPNAYVFYGGGCFYIFSEVDKSKYSLKIIENARYI